MADGKQTSWSELLGSNNWKGLLDPMDLDLRKLIIRAGSFCQATYDAFDSDAHSKYCGSSRYGKRGFFDKVMLESAADFEMVSFLYTTVHLNLLGSCILRSVANNPWSTDSNWMGYIAVNSDTSYQATGKRVIYVAWRGTIQSSEWVKDLNSELVPLTPILNSTYQAKWGITDLMHLPGIGNPKVMRGWYDIYTGFNDKSQFSKISARAQLHERIKQLVQIFKDEDLSIVITGHSLGASLATLSAFDIVENGLTHISDNRNIPVTAIVFACPMVGDQGFKSRLSKLPNLKILSVRNELDLVPHYPSMLLGYQYTGTDVVVTTKKSPYLKDSKSPLDWHNLEALLHIIAGWMGKNGAFKLQVQRSIALVNKSSEFLKDECLIPGSWWVEKNKSMVRNKNGEWKLAEPDEEDIPVPETEKMIYPFVI